MMWLIGIIAGGAALAVAALTRRKWLRRLLILTGVTVLVACLLWGGLVMVLLNGID